MSWGHLFFWFKKVPIFCQTSSVDSQLVKSKVFQLKVSKQIGRLKYLFAQNQLTSASYSFACTAFGCLLRLPHPCQIWTGKKKETNAHIHTSCSVYPPFDISITIVKETPIEPSSWVKPVCINPPVTTSPVLGPYCCKKEKKSIFEYKRLSANSTHVFLKSTYSTLKQVKSCACSLYTHSALYMSYIKGTVKLYKRCRFPKQPQIIFLISLKNSIKKLNFCNFFESPISNCTRQMLKKVIK